jgi:hypothetical protein
MTILYKYNRDDRGVIIADEPMDHLLYIPRQANLQDKNDLPIQQFSDPIEVMDVASTQGTIFVYATN